MTSPNPFPIANAYELLIQAVVDYAIYMLDVEGRVTTWNPGAERLTKPFSIEALAGRVKSIIAAAN